MTLVKAPYLSDLPFHICKNGNNNGTFPHDYKASPRANVDKALRTRSGTQKVLNERIVTVNIYILLIR